MKRVLTRDLWVRKGAIGTIAVLLSLVATRPICAQDGPALAANLLTNAGIEAGNGSTPDGWSQGAALDGVTYLWDKKSSHTGAASLCLQKTAARYYPVAQWSQAIPSTASSGSVTVSAWIKAQDVTKAILDVQFLDDKGSPLPHHWTAYIGAKEAGDPPVTHDWKLYTDTVAIPPGTKQIVIAPQIYGPGTVWFDDFETKFAP